MAQILLPDSDIAVGSWTVTPLWSKVDDDLTAQPSGDGTTIQSDAVGNNTDTTTAELGLAAGTDPESSSGHIIRVRWKNGDEGGQAGRDIDGTVELVEGASIRATLGPITLAYNAGEQTDTYTLTGAEADAINDYSALEFHMRGRGNGGGPARSLVVEAVELEIPDAVTLPFPPLLNRSETKRNTLLRI